MWVNCKHFSYFRLQLVAQLQKLIETSAQQSVSLSIVLDLEILEPADEFCDIPCCSKDSGICMVKPCPLCQEEAKTFTCGGDAGIFSIFNNFAAPVTIGMNMELVNRAGENVAIHYPSSSVSMLPTVSAITDNSSFNSELFNTSEKHEPQVHQAPNTHIKWNIPPNVWGTIKIKNSWQMHPNSDYLWK